MLTKTFLFYLLLTTNITLSQYITNFFQPQATFHTPSLSSFSVSNLNSPSILFIIILLLRRCPSCPHSIFFILGIGLILLNKVPHNHRCFDTTSTLLTVLKVRPTNQLVKVVLNELK